MRAAPEVVRGRRTDALDRAILDFWESEAGFTGPAARERLEQVVCVLRDDAGAVAGVNSVVAATVELVGGRPFWIYRSLVRAGDDAMFAAAYDALAGEFDSEAGGPIGVCRLIDDRDEMARRPEAEWSDPRQLFAGYLDDGVQVRVAYFPRARISGPGPLAPEFQVDLSELPYAVARFDEQDLFGEEEVIDLWLDAGVVDAREAHRRRHELHMVAWRKSDGELGGVTTTWLKRNDQLGLDFWHYRTFVAPAHRKSFAALILSIEGIADVWERRGDGRGAGILVDVEHPMLRRMYDFANWGPMDLTFVGQRTDGAYLMVRYFPGVAAPLPS